MDCWVSVLHQWLIKMLCEKQSRPGCILITRSRLAWCSLCAAACRTQSQQGPSGRRGLGCCCRWSKHSTAQGITERDECCRVCVWVCVCSHLGVPSNRSFNPCFQGFSEPETLRPREGVWAGWAGTSQPIRTGGLSPILIPNHSQDKASCPPRTSPAAATLKTSNTTSTCPPRYRGLNHELLYR